MLRHSASRFHFLFFCLLPLLPLLLTWSPLLDPTTGLFPPGDGEGQYSEACLAGRRRQTLTFPFHLGFIPQTWVLILILTARKFEMLSLGWWFLSKARVLKSPCGWRQEHVPLTCWLFLSEIGGESIFWLRGERLVQDYGCVSTYLWKTVKPSSKGKHKLILTDFRKAFQLLIASANSLEF